jgi:hypothetical protein
MSYLFGDSTPSPFRIDFIEFLRLAIGFCAHVVRVEERVFAEQTRRMRIEEDIETDRRHLNELLGRLTDTILQHASNEVRPRVAEHVEKIQSNARAVVESGLKALDEALAKDLAEIAQIIKVERKSNLSALEKVLLFCSLPEAKDTIHVRLAEGGRYSAWIESITPYDIETVVDLAIPADSIFAAQDARVERLVDAVEIRTPETGGWIRKESRMASHKLGRFHIVEMAVGEDFLIKLRSSPEAPANGFDLSVRGEASQLGVVKIGRDAEGSGSFDPEPGDIQNILPLREKLEEEARRLSTKRRALTSARLGGEPIEESARMRSVVEQLVQVMAPMVREIAAHSLSPDELVLRRKMEDGRRREEIFITKAELRANFDGLNDEDRCLFDSLELDQTRARPTSAKPRPPLPPPLPLKRSQPPPPPPMAESAGPRD